MNIIKLSIALYIVAIATIIIYNTSPYGFFDDSISGKKRHNIIMNGWGEYKIRYWTSNQHDIISETGTYSDPGDNEITLTPKEGHTYKIRVWGRGTKRPQYRLSLEKSPMQ
jgi:hypothetical protein